MSWTGTTWKGKKVTFALQQAMKAQGGSSYSSLSLTSALDQSGCSTPHRRFTPRKETKFSSHRKLGGFQGRPVRVRKISPPQGFEHRTVQPVESSNTDWAIPAHETTLSLPFFYQGTTLTTAENVTRSQLRITENLPDHGVDESAVSRIEAINLITYCRSDHKVV